ncbi:MAG: acyl-CoA synthetase [Candidatus Rokubacteria bacterium]|nr:acyl-CoA synthetase [Candidatus Rokubacteria bacterium]
MHAILAARRYPDARERFRWDALWDLFDGDRERLNLAHECVDRHAGDATALRIALADGRRAEHTFRELTEWSSRVARFLERHGIGRGDRVGLMLEPSLPLYAALFGTLKRGAVAVPLFTLFGPEGLALRVNDCRPRLLLVDRDAERWQREFPALRVLAFDEAALATLSTERSDYAPSTAADDVAVLQYTSGTTRGLPAAIRHTHRSVVTLMVAALYGVGLERGDRYFCPSSPAWGHGLWHGTIAPLALGIAAGSYAGRFDARRLLEALHAFEVTNVAAAPTVFRLVRRSGLVRNHGGPRNGPPNPPTLAHAPGDPGRGSTIGRVHGPPLRLRKLSFTGEPMDSGTWDFIEHDLRVTPCGMYGSTEVGVIIANYPGFEGYEVRRGALGTAAPGWEVGVVDERGQPVPPRVMGEIAVRRKGAWFLVKDRGFVDEDGYFHHGGRSDDVIISAGWTMSAVEIEDVLMAHPDVREAAVVGVADALRGQVAKAFVVAGRRGDAFEHELQDWVRMRLSLHEYPRRIEVVDGLPKTPAGKIDRKALRELD